MNIFVSEIEVQVKEEEKSSILEGISHKTLSEIIGILSIKGDEIGNICRTLQLLSKNITLNRDQVNKAIKDFEDTMIRVLQKFKIAAK
jgi:hypothetical protein